MDKTKLRLPIPTPETEHFWAATRSGELKLQRCDSCDEAYFPPRPFCPMCSSTSVKEFVASGRATLYSFVINHRPHPAFDGPYSIAVVTLEEGPRMMTNIVNCEQSPDQLILDMPLKVVFEAVSDDITLPYFEPLEASS